MNIGDNVVFIDGAGVKHNAIVGAASESHPDHISLVYLDEAKAAQVFNTGSFEDSIVRVVMITAAKDEESRHCWVRETRSIDDPITAENVNDPIEIVMGAGPNAKPIDVATLLDQAGPAPIETEHTDPA